MGVLTFRLAEDEEKKNQDYYNRDGEIAQGCEQPLGDSLTHTKTIMFYNSLTTTKKTLIVKVQMREFNSFLTLFLNLFNPRDSTMG